MFDVVNDAFISKFIAMLVFNVENCAYNHVFKENLLNDSELYKQEMRNVDTYVPSMNHPPSEEI